MSIMGRIPVTVVAEQLESDKPPTDNNYKVATKREKKEFKALGNNQRQAETKGKLTLEKRESPWTRFMFEWLFP